MSFWGGQPWPGPFWPWRKSSLARYLASTRSVDGFNFQSVNRLGKFIKLEGKWVPANTDLNPPDPARPRTDPTAQEKQLSSESTATRMSDGSFHVHSVLNAYGGHSHHLSADCPICHRTLTVIAFGPKDMPKFAKEEAQRLALLAHYRTDLSDHAPKRKNKQPSPPE